MILQLFQQFLLRYRHLPNEHLEAIERAEQNRATYLLASSIVDRLNPEEATDLETPGEVRLRQIVNWMRGA
jgi:hypothetical protein